uniref:Dynactin subunit 3 n=1 Tax=Panagrellus redivivus TaxID=6233 RepID=A0A7E4WCR9_PANRE
MDLLNERLAVIEKATGDFSLNRKPVGLEIAAVRGRFKELKGESILKIPEEDLTKLLKRNALADELTPDEKLFVIEYKLPQIEKNAELIAEMKHLSEVVFNSEHLQSSPDAAEIDSIAAELAECRQKMEEVEKQTKDLLFNFVIPFNELCTEIRALKEKSKLADE